MGLFDILGNPMVQEQIRNFAGKSGFDLGALLGGKSGLDFGAIAGKMVSGSGGMMGAGALGALLGAVMPKGAAKAASVLGLGAVAYSFYKKWAQGQQQESQAFAQIPDSFSADPASLLLLRTIIYAAKADGHIDEMERARIEALVPQLFPGQDVQPLVDQVLRESADLKVLVSGLQAPEQGEDLYRLSCIIMDVDHFAERGYLAELGHALGISAARMQELEQEAAQAKQQIDSF